MSDERLLVVIGDSMTYWRQEGEGVVDDPRTWPQRMGAHLEEMTGERWEVVNLAHGGRTAFDAHKLLRQDARTRELVASADAVVFQVCGKDGVLCPFPRPARLVLGRIPQRYRGRFVRFVRHRLAKVTSRTFQFTPPRLFRRSWFGSIELIRTLNPTADLVCAAPTREYGPQTIVPMPGNWSEPGGHRDVVRSFAARAGVPCFDQGQIVEESRGEWTETPDYLHWPDHVHDHAGRCAAELLLAARAGTRERVSG